MPKKRGLSKRPPGRGKLLLLFALNKIPK